MSDVMERDDLLQETAEQAPETFKTAEATEQTAPESPQKKTVSKKKRRRWVRRIIALAVVAALAVGLVKYFGGDESGETQVITDFVQYGAITATVESNGLTKAKNSETITMSTAGTVLEVLVSEGQLVTAGTPLFVIDSPAAQVAVEKARQQVEGYEKQLTQLHKDIAGLNLSATYSGKLLDTVKLNPGEEIGKGTKVATLVDDTRLRLVQYYSYAYEGDLRAGQEVSVSIPALMTTVPGRIEQVHMVSRITPEGSRLFSAEIVVENEGALTAEMLASATVNVNGEAVYPYEQGKLEYYRTSDLCATVSGTVLSSNLIDHLPVYAGQVLVNIDGADSETEIFTVQQSLEEALKELETAEKNLANCNAVAPIDGTIIGLTLQPGAEVAANSSVVTISDTSSLIINATVDERNISYIKPGMMVDLDQWGTMAMGMVETVSLSSTVNNGVATYPITIVADNFDGSLQVNSYINFTIIASQNDNCLVVPIQCVRTVTQEDGTAVNAVYVGGEKPENALENVMVDEMIPEGYWPVPVEIGIQDNYNVEIRSGLEEGTEIFTQIQTMDAWG